MCGIVGYVGNRDALPVIISGLEKLEYRGYDSAGVAIYENGKIVVQRAVGKLSNLKKLVAERPANAKRPIGIGHTRWATHGKPSEDNAHPHTAGRVSIIHNGIIENYLELRAELQKSGAVFKSETDTEIAAHLMDRFLASGMKPFAALKATCERIRGSYAFVAIDSENPDRILVAKNATPIIIGIGEGEMFVASGIPAVLSATRKIVVLEDGDLAEITAAGANIFNGGKAVERPVQNITWDPVTAEKGGYKHFMLKEIHEQPQVVADTFRGRIERTPHSRVVLPEVGLTGEQLKKIDRVVLLGCGTAWHAGLVGKFYIETLAGIPCEVDYSSEFRYRTQVCNERTLVIPVSQSGETADTLMAVDQVRAKSVTMAVCNVLGSSLTRKVMTTLFCHAGPEISVCSTKAFTSQLVALYLLAAWLAEQRGVLDPQRAAGLVDDLIRLPQVLDEALKVLPAVEKLAGKFHTAKDFLFLGRGACYPIALEGALKLKEISYIHAEGYPAGEMKHGPIALIDEAMPVVVVLQNSPEIFDKALSNLKEVESRGGRIIAVTDCQGHAELHRVAEQVIEVPFISPLLSPVVLTLPLQALAYYVAVLKGTDVDLPRNLAKSVTVE